MAIVSVCFASLFLAIANLLMRKSLDAGGTTKTYLLLQLGVCLGVSIFLGPVRTGAYAINGPVIAFGLFTGVVLSSLLFFLGKALEKGPPGLTFSILSAGAVFPGLVMAAFLGEKYGYPYTPWHGLGSLFVLIGLFWAGRTTADRTAERSRIWVGLVTTMFFLHILLLLLYQGRGALISHRELISFISAEQMGSWWFVPMMYVGSVAVQLSVCLKTERRRPYRLEWIYGFLGGISNCLCTFFLLHGTEIAVGLENAILFPLYSIGTILFSNLWGQRLYKENVNWRACQLCAVGILLGSVDWKVVATAIGF